MWRRTIVLLIAVVSLASACTSTERSSTTIAADAPASAPAGSLGPAVQTDVTVARVVANDAIPAFGSPGDAAIDAARAHQADLRNARVTRMVAIYADDTTVDLRVEVMADGFCHWYGVGGQVRAGALEWRASPARACDG
jgi:hypothetical protein